MQKTPEKGVHHREKPSSPKREAPTKLAKNQHQNPSDSALCRPDAGFVILDE
jgi:hypothetical protein